MIIQVTENTNTFAKDEISFEKALPVEAENSLLALFNLKQAGIKEFTENCKLNLEL